MFGARAAAVSLLLLAAGCESIHSTPQAKLAHAHLALCDGDTISIYTDFAGAGANSCAITGASEITVEIVPETMPINPSPWYAFRVEAPAGTVASIRLRYAGTKHRYAPWILGPSGGWRALPAQDVQIAPDGSAAVKLPALAGPTLVAAHPLDNQDAAKKPWHALARQGKLELIEAGPTADGRPLTMFLHSPVGAKGLVVLTARQHPPEVPGAVAFDAFAERLFSQDAGAVAVRNEVAIFLVPVINPDGIARGYWRGNAAAADLNRDWGNFVQLESRAVGQKIMGLAEGLPLLALIDFHATRRDVIYAPPLDPRRRDTGEAFLALFAATPEGRDIPVSRSHEAGSGTLKGWALDRFGISGLTYEVADGADREATRKRAVAAADSFGMALLAQAPLVPIDATKGAQTQ